MDFLQSSISWDGVGAAAPLFIEVTVAQVLGLNATFKEPLTQTPNLSFGALAGIEDADGMVRELQMSSRFATEGTAYYAKFMNVSQDCRWDTDCVLADARVDTCTESTTCTPRQVSGYSGGAFPGHLFEDPQGFPSILQPGHQLTVFVSFLFADFVDLGEELLNVTGYKEVTVRLHQLRMAGIRRGLENCNSTAQGSQGVDCLGPASTVNLGPLMAGAPFYSSAPFFKESAFEDHASMNAGQAISPYNAAERVLLFGCVGHAWCISARSDPDHHRGVIWVEPELGLPLEAKSVTQLNVRLADKPMVLFPHLSDMLVPVFGSVNISVPLRQCSGMLRSCRPRLLHWRGRRTFCWWWALCLCSLACCLLLVAFLFAGRQTLMRMAAPPR